MGDNSRMKISRQIDDASTTLPPRFGLSHLFLWMTCCAIYLAAVGEMSEQEPGAIGLAIVSFTAVGYGAALSGLLIFLSRRIRRVRWPIEPGEWLVLALGAQLSAELAMYRWLVPDPIRSPGGVAAVITCCLLVLPMLDRHVTKPWKAYCCIVLLFFVKPLVDYCLVLLDLQIILPSALGAALLDYRWLILPFLATIVCVYDRVHEMRRGWLHWAGLGTLIWYLIAVDWVRSQ